MGLRAKRIGIILIVLLVGLSFVVFADGISQWASTDVQAVFDSDLISDTYFDHYQQAITRQEYGYLMFQLYEHLTGQPLSHIVNLETSYAFSDTSDLYLIALTGAGLITGYPDGSFRPDNPISREEIMVLYMRVLEKAGYEVAESTLNFKDKQAISSWAYSAAEKCISLGIIKGRDDNLLDPKGNATVEESLVVFNRILNHKDIKAAEALPYVVGDSIVSNGYRTYAIHYDLVGNPVGIDVYRDFDYMEQVVFGTVGHRLCLAGNQLYYESEEGTLKALTGVQPLVTDVVTGKAWFVKDQRLYLTESVGIKEYDLATGALLGVTVDASLLNETSLLSEMKNGDLFYQGSLLLENVKDYAITGHRIFILKENNELVNYEITTNQWITFGQVEGDRISVTGNYMVLYIPVHNDTTFVQFMPLFDIRRFTGN